MCVFQGSEGLPLVLLLLFGGGNNYISSVSAQKSTNRPEDEIKNHNGFIAPPVFALFAHWPHCLPSSSPGQASDFAEDEEKGERGVEGGEMLLLLSLLKKMSQLKILFVYRPSASH